MIRSTTIKANHNTIKVLERMALDKKEHRNKIIAKIKEKAKDNN
ncbi:hypothetical protein GCM10022291_06140 [Postechiella marina]|uniref:Uncharacterized protein n=1 Tax=Postechiella marina TaxID=943941 RepID=A0ABP8C1U5_9FLAO